MSRTRYLATRSVVAGGAVVGAAAALLAVAPAASAANVRSGHYDVKANVDCAARTIAIKGENHSTEVEYSLDSLTFVVNSSSAVATTANDTAKFGSAPVRVLTENESLSPPKTVLGFEAEYMNCSVLPTVKYQRTGTATVPSTGRAASYANSGGTTTEIDSSTASGRNVGVSTTGHSDRRWGFTKTGSYVLPITASVTFPAGGGTKTSTDNLRFAVS